MARKGNNGPPPINGGIGLDPEAEALARAQAESPEGEVLTEEAWKQHEFEWLPGPKDYGFVQSLMTGRVTEPGKFANWIAPPLRGINNKRLNFEYVRFN